MCKINVVKNNLNGLISIAGTFIDIFKYYVLQMNAGKFVKCMLGKNYFISHFPSLRWQNFLKPYTLFQIYTKMNIFWIGTFEEILISF